MCTCVTIWVVLKIRTFGRDKLSVQTFSEGVTKLIYDSTDHICPPTSSHFEGILNKASFSTFDCLIMHWKSWGQQGVTNILLQFLEKSWKITII